MKKRIILLLLAVSFGCSAQLTPKYAFDWFDGGGENFFLREKSDGYVKNIDMNKGEFRVRLGADYKIKRFVVYFDTRMYMFSDFTQPLNGVFSPSQSEFYFGVNYLINSKIKLTVEHQCIHPMITAGQQITRMYGGYNRIGISYNYKD